MVYIKSEYDIQMIEQAASIWKQVRKMLITSTHDGVSLIELDRKAADLIEKLGGVCSFYNYHGFPGHICISVNDQIIHGIPNDYVIRPNDLITFDVGVTYKNHYCDAAFTVHIKPVTDEPARINYAAKSCLMSAIAVIKPGNTIGDISNAIEQVAHENGYSVINDFGGHGCGNKLHEDPIIMNYGAPHSGLKLVSGMTLCIEPMLMTQTQKYIIDKKNHWTVSSDNHKLTCHWEHMILVNDHGCKILTNEE